MTTLFTVFGSKNSGASEIQQDSDQDFVLRPIRQLAKAIASLLQGSPAPAQLHEAEEALREAAREALSIDPHWLDHLTPSSAMKLLDSPERVAAYIEVVETQARLAHASGDKLRGDTLVQRAHRLRSRDTG